MAEARHPRRGMAPENDPLAMGGAYDLSAFDTGWGTSLLQNYGSFSPQSGTWDELLKSGPTAAVGAQWKQADFAGDLLPPSSTLLHANYRYAYLRGDDDVQLVGPNGFVGDVESMRLNLLEAGVTQRFTSWTRRGLFVDVGAGLGVGGANGKIIDALPNPAAETLFVEKRNEDAILVRGELTTGVGLQFNSWEMRFGISTGLSGTSALNDQFRTQGDIGGRMGLTIHLFD